MTQNHVLPAGTCSLPPSPALLPLVYASQVSVGDCIMTVEGQETVLTVEKVQGEGLYTVVTNEVKPKPCLNPSPSFLHFSYLFLHISSNSLSCFRRIFSSPRFPLILYSPFIRNTWSWTALLHHLLVLTTCSPTCTTTCTAWCTPQPQCYSAPLGWTERTRWVDALHYVEMRCDVVDVSSVLHFLASLNSSSYLNSRLPCDVFCFLHSLLLIHYILEYQVYPYLFTSSYLSCSTLFYQALGFMVPLFGLSN